MVECSLPNYVDLGSNTVAVIYPAVFKFGVASVKLSLSELVTLKRICLSESFKVISVVLYPDI